MTAELFKSRPDMMPLQLPEGWTIVDSHGLSLAKKTPERTRWIAEFLKTQGVTQGAIRFGGRTLAFKYKGNFVEMDINTRFRSGRFLLWFSPTWPSGKIFRYFAQHASQTVKLPLTVDIDNANKKDLVVSGLQQLMEQIPVSQEQ